MSAFVVDKNHILYLVEAAVHFARHWHGPFRWRICSDENVEASVLYCGDRTAMVQAANMLWRENVRSVQFRYRGESEETLPGPIDKRHVVTEKDFDGMRWDHFDPVQVLMSCNCYDYQTCEHPEYPESSAFGFVEALKSHAISSLPGYDDCAWGSPATLAERQEEFQAVRKKALQQMAN